MSQNDDIDELLRKLGDEDFSTIPENNFDIEQLTLENEAKENQLPQSLGFLTKNEQSLKEIENTEATINKQHNNFSELINSISSDTLTFTKQIKNEIKVPEFNMPTEFINYMETEYVKSKIEDNEHIFQIKNYKQHTKLNYLVWKFINKSKLSARFVKNSNLITSITVKQNYLFTGDNLGQVRMYSYDSEIEHKSLILNEIKTANKKSVVCMDISDNLTVLAVGYLNGYVALWDISSGKCKRLITDAHANSSIIAIKFLRAENKYYEIISSDLKGRVNKIAISEGFFITNVDIIKVMEYKIPIFLVEILKLTAEEKKKYYDKKDNPVIIAFGCLEYVLIYLLEPETKKLFMLERPKYFNKENNRYPIPDVSYGVGYCPRDLNKPGVKKTDLLRIIAISWGKVVYLYYLPFDVNKGPLEVIHIGHYVNENQILRMGFLSTSIFFVFDITKKFLLINTSLVSPKEVKIDPSTNQPIQPTYKIESPVIDVSQQEGQNISLQAYLPDKGSKDATATKATYNNIIINQKGSFCFLGKSQFYLVEIFDWEKCLILLKGNAEWLGALSLGLDLFYGKKRALPGIPIEEKERKTIVGYELNKLILEYATMTIGNDFSRLNKEAALEALSKNINVCIEFCLEINDVNYLLNQIYPVFDLKGYTNLFIEKLEPFILCDKIKNYDLGELTISRIVNYYLDTKKIDTLSQLLTHLDISSIDREDIKKTCIDNNLITPLIYIYMNGKEDDYFFPIKTMYEMFHQFSPLPRKVFEDYSTCLNNVSICDLEKSRQFIGHKLLWYINLCLDKRKFPSNDIIEEEKYTNIVSSIFLWIMKNDIITELMNFDSFSLFAILTRFFTEIPIFEIIKNINYDKEKFKDILIYGTQIVDFELKTFIDIIVDKAERVNKIYALFDMNEFLILISSKIDVLEKKQIFDAVKYLLEFSSKSKKEEALNEEDNFIYHKRYWKSKDFDINLSNELKGVILHRKKSFTNDDFYQLLAICDKSTLVMVKIFLLIQTGNYSQCLNTYLFDEGIINRTDKTFDFINKSLKELTDSKQNDKIKLFQEEILSKYIHLASLSIKELTKLNQNWFNDNHSRALEKLSPKKECQLEYVETVLEGFKEDELPPNLMDTYLFLLTTHIDLLCKLNKIDEILPNLKKRQAYPIDCITKCLEAKAYDAAIYLYNTTGKIDDSFNLSVNILKETFDDLFKAVRAKDVNGYTNLIRVHKVNLDRCMSICKDNSDKSDSADTEQMWFKLLQIFYSTLNEARELKVVESEEMVSDLQVTISTNIKTILNIMNSYVSIKTIIQFVTMNQKQAEYKEFKEILKTMLFTYTLYNNILHCTRKLISRTVRRSEEEYTRELRIGNVYHLLKCEECEKEFDIEEKIMIFKCGHQIHLSCCTKNKTDLFCPICRREEIENQATSGDTSRIMLGDTQMEHMVLKSSNQKAESGKEKEKLMQIKIRNSKFDKLRSLDKRFLETSTLVY